MKLIKETAKYGDCYVEFNYDKPLMWYNYECAATPGLNSWSFPAIMVQTESGDEICISNHEGIGNHALNNPQTKLFLLPKESFQESGNGKRLEFSEKRFAENENNRYLWQKKNFPKELRKSKRKRENFKTFKK